MADPNHDIDHQFREAFEGATDSSRMAAGWQALQAGLPPTLFGSVLLGKLTTLKGGLVGISSLALVSTMTWLTIANSAGSDQLAQYLPEGQDLTVEGVPSAAHEQLLVANLPETREWMVGNRMIMEEKAAGNRSASIDPLSSPQPEITSRSEYLASAPSKKSKVAEDDHRNAEFQVDYSAAHEHKREMVNAALAGAIESQASMKEVSSGNFNEVTNEDASATSLSSSGDFWKALPLADISDLPERNRVAALEKPQNRLISVKPPSPPPSYTQPEWNLSVSAGANGSRGFSNVPQTAGSFEITPTVGIGGEFLLNRSISVMLEAQYVKRSGHQLRHQTEQTEYFLDWEKTTQEITVNSIEYLQIPITARFNLGSRHSLVGGGFASILLNTTGERKEIFETPGVYRETVIGDRKGYTAGLEQSTFGMTAGYEFEVQSFLVLGGRVYQGISDQTENQLFSPDLAQTDRTRDFQVYLRYKFN